MGMPAKVAWGKTAARPTLNPAGSAMKTADPRIARSGEAMRGAEAMPQMVVTAMITRPVMNTDWGPFHSWARSPPDNGMHAAQRGTLTAAIESAEQTEARRRGIQNFQRGTGRSRRNVSVPADLSPAKH